MISSGYTLDLYCDHPNHKIEYFYSSTNDGILEDFDQFFSDEKNPKTDCFRQARKAGWKINLKERTCICPKCSEKK